MSKIQTGITIQQLILGQGTPYINMQSSTIHEITTQSENTLGQRATSSRLYSCSIISGPLCSPIVGRLDGLRKDCGGFCQEVERVGSDLNCAGSLCLKVLHCNQFQSLTLTTLYRHTVGFCRIDQTGCTSVIPPPFLLPGFRIVYNCGGLCQEVERVGRSWGRGTCSWWIAIEL